MVDYWTEQLTTGGLMMGFMELYGTNQSFIVELGFLGVPSDEDHQR